MENYLAILRDLFKSSKNFDFRERGFGHFVFPIHASHPTLARISSEENFGMRVPQPKARIV